MTSDRIVRFDGFELDRHTLELRQSGAIVKLQQQPARVLSILIEHAGDLVSRETLRKAIWNDDAFVDFDRGMNYCISQIRIALGDTADAPRYLETLRGRGYRFIGKLETQTATAPRQPWIAIAVSVALLVVLAAWGASIRQNTVRPAIGVAPLTTPASERQWAAAMHAQTVSRLSIASRTPVIDLAQSSASKTRWLLEGRVDRSAAQYRVTMLLRDTRDGSVRWSDVFAGSPGDWVDAQSEMADRMTEAIRYFVEGPSAGMPKRRSKLPPRTAMKR